VYPPFDSEPVIGFGFAMAGDAAASAAASAAMVTRRAMLRS
jgi:hypothetical protein